MRNYTAQSELISKWRTAGFCLIVASLDHVTTDQSIGPLTSASLEIYTQITKGLSVFVFFKGDYLCFDSFYCRRKIGDLYAHMNAYVSTTFFIVNVIYAVEKRN